MSTGEMGAQHAIRRQWLVWLALCAWGGGCTTDSAVERGSAVDQQRRLKGIGLVLVVDAVAGAEMKGVSFQNDRGNQIYSSGVVARRNREIMSLGGIWVPLTVRVVWREDARLDYSRATWYGGTIVGDYTIPIAERIPDEVLRDIRANGGALRLKFRLKPDGVLFGWDIERPGGGISRFDMPGGDFLETRY